MKTFLKKSIPLISTITLLSLLSCTARHGTDIIDPPGFWLGLWHGIIAPVAFVIGLFSDIKMYAWPNGGGWYDFGFLLGIGTWGGGGGAAACRKKNC